MESELFKTFAFHCGVVLGKTLLMSPLTSRQRLKNSVFSNPEDTSLKPNGKIDFNNGDVERVRRAHQNDLENIIPFVLVGGLYLTTNPSLGTAKLLFRTFSITRIMHSIVYLWAVPQPSRFLAFLAGMGVNVFMTFQAKIFSKMDITHELFSTFAFHCGLVLAKTLIMSFWTAKARFANASFANPEDAKTSGAKVERGNENVERIRRIHQNDLENVLPFVMIGALYITTNPALATAKLAFRIFTVARYVHTFVYAFAVPQPSRALAYFANQAVCGYMLYSIFTKYCAHF